jgi:hypothetical protein
MKYVKTYESFRNDENAEPVNEEIIKKLFNAATGALKNFLGNITQPFKQLSDDFKKGMKLEDAKKKMIATVDAILKSASDNINKAEDENAINQIKDAFKKEIDEKAAQFDKDIKAIKESKLIMEGAIKDTMLGARVMIGMLKDTAAKFKEEYDKKFAAAKDLAAKKAIAAEEMKKIVEEFKKQINDENAFKAAQDKYVKDNKIEGVGGGGKGTLVLEWGGGEVDVEIKLPEKEGTDRYEITKSTSKKLKLPEGKTIFCDITGEVKKGNKIKLEKLTIAGGGEFKIDGKDFYETGTIEKIEVDGKEVDDYKLGEAKAEGQEDLVKKLGELKAKKPDDIKKVAKFVDFISDEKNKGAKEFIIEEGK